MMNDKRFLSDGVVELHLKKVIRNYWLIPTAYQYEIFKCGYQIPIGHCDYRCEDNWENYYGGNIGYMIYKAYRGNHYAWRAAVLLCELAVGLKAKQLIITCSPENIASHKTIERLGGVFVECVDVPAEHYLYGQGEKVKEIFKLDLTKHGKDLSI